MKPTNPNAHTYVEDNDVKVSIMTWDENVNAHTCRRTVEQRHCSESVFSPRQQHWRRNAVARGKQRLPRHASHARRTYHTWNVFCWEPPASMQQDKMYGSTNRKVSWTCWNTHVGRGHPVVAPSTLDASTALVLQSCTATQSSPARTYEPHEAQL